MKTLDQIRFEVSVNLINNRLEKFERYLDESEEDNFDYPAIYQTIICHQKSTEGYESEVLETEEFDEEFPRKNRRRGKKFNKSAWMRKERQKSLHNLVDWTEKDWWQSVDDGGRRIGEKGDKLYTRKGRVTRDKFTEEPVTDEESVFTICDTDLSLDTNSEIWTDEEISQAVKEYHTLYEKYEDDEEEYDFGYDPYQNAIDDREAAWDEISDLKRQINIYKDFIGEFNLNTLYERWLAIR